MYIEYTDILSRISTYATTLSQFKDQIREVNVRNEIVEHFGKHYCRIYIDISPIGDAASFDKIYEIIDKGLYGQPRYFSFYLPDGADEHNREEEVHYNYIWHLLTWFLKGKVEVKADSFKTKRDIRREEEQNEREYEEKKKAIEDAVSSLTIEPGIFVAVRNLLDLDIGIVSNVVSPNKNSNLSVEIYLLKKDLTPGKKKVVFSSKSEVYAIVQPYALPVNISKDQLLTLIENNQSFEGLSWRRPENLW